LYRYGFNRGLHFAMPEGVHNFKYPSKFSAKYVHKGITRKITAVLQYKQDSRCLF